MALITGQSGTRMRTLGTTGSGAQQSPTYFDPAQRRSELFNTKEYDTPQYTAAGPIAVDSSNNINAGPRVFGRLGGAEATAPIAESRLKWERNNRRLGLLGDDEAVANEANRRAMVEGGLRTQHAKRTDLAAGQRVADERDMAAAAERDKYGISDEALWRTNRQQSGGLNPFSRMTDLTTVRKLDPNRYPEGAAMQEAGAAFNAEDPYGVFSGRQTGNVTDSAYSEGEYFLKQQKLQAQQDRTRLGSYVYNDTLRELWEGDAPMPTTNQWGRATGGAGVNLQAERYVGLDPAYDRENPDPFKQKYAAPGASFGQYT